MKKLRDIFVANRLFFSFFVFFFIVGLIFLLAEGKAAVFFALNPFHRSALDTFFVYLTFLGDGLFTLIIIVLFLVMLRLSESCQILHSFFLSSIPSPLLKFIF